MRFQGFGGGSPLRRAMSRPAFPWPQGASMLHGTFGPASGAFLPPGSTVPSIHPPTGGPQRVTGGPQTVAIGSPSAPAAPAPQPAPAAPAPANAAGAASPLQAAMLNPPAPTPAPAPGLGAHSTPQEYFRQYAPNLMLP